MTAPFGQAGTAKYVRLTTFRKDGTPVATPIWAALDGEALLMWTVSDSWKVKRLRRNTAVIVQACDMRGKQTFGPPVKGTATVLDSEGTDHAREVIIKKYGIMGWLTVKGSLLRRGKNGTIGLKVVADA
ncbi:PPOX class F420-dependent oxidoreductase [Nocardia sp. 348MFTsu5.1]|uniref:PPOX class F420-dependent oxidoreductase n=1 Tax=Nocardia sp. 348MFTsu5.1 TaxID=1172185 RepID=UPI00035E2AE5|nr:PPOX class F420-dependent oxidoreductase [Nocardia sp. 348MFTsu5.1]